MSNPWSKSYEDLRNSIDEASSSYLEKDMKKRQKNNEKARKDMEKMGSMKNPHFGSGPTGSMSSEEAEGMHREALTGDRIKKAIKKPGGMAYTRKVSEDPAKRGKKGGRGGESDFSAGDRGTGNKAARRAGTYKEGLDPVGQEDKDIDNDGDHDKSDKYLAKRRKAIGKAMKNQKEDWRSSLGFIDEAGCSDDEDKKDMKKIGKGEVKNKINVMPNVKMGKQNESANLCPVCGYEPCQCPPEQRIGEEKDPCWDTHKQVGMKKKGGKMVPNCVPKTKSEALEVPQQENPKRQQKMSQAAAQYSKSKKKSADFPTEELDFYLDETKSGSLFKRIKEASWDMKTGKAKDPKQRAKDAQKAAEMKARDKRAGRRTYGSAKLGYAKKDWDE